MVVKRPKTQDGGSKYKKVVVPAVQSLGERKKDFRSFGDPTIKKKKRKKNLSLPEGGGSEAVIKKGQKKKKKKVAAGGDNPSEKKRMVVKEKNMQRTEARKLNKEKISKIPSVPVGKAKKRRASPKDENSEGDEDAAPKKKPKKLVPAGTFIGGKVRAKLPAISGPTTGPEYWKKYKTVRRDQRQKLVSEDQVLGLSANAKALWEKLRNSHTPSSEKEKLCKDLHKLVRGKVKQLIFAPDTSRVIECLMQHGDVQIRAALFEELKDQVVELSESLYGHFFVIKILKYGAKPQKEFVMESFRGKVVALMKHKIASSVVECAFNDWANITQRGLMLQEFYDNELAVFKDTEITSLRKYLEKYPERTKTALETLRSNIQPVLDKGIVTSNLVQSLISEYLMFCKDAERTTLIESLREHILAMIHTKEGARVGMMAIWYGDAKDRKTMLKTWKDKVKEVACEECGHLVLLAALDAVDDTVMLRKVVLNEIFANLISIARHPVGRKVLLYLLAPRDPHYFHGDVVRILAQGDGNPHSKKDESIRRSEILAAVSAPLLKSVVRVPHIWLQTNNICILTGAILLHAKCADTSLMQEARSKVASLYLSPDPLPSPGEVEGDKEEDIDDSVPTSSSVEDNSDATLPTVERPATHMMYKKMLQVETEEETAFFSRAIVSGLTPMVIEHWISSNRGCFSLLLLAESKVLSVSSGVLKKLTPLKNAIKAQKSIGAKLLLKKLSS